MNDPTKLLMLDSGAFNKAAERFWNKVFRRSKTKCWLWQGYCDEEGYGRFWFERGMIPAHRFSMMRFLNKRLNAEEYVLHDCPTGDTPGCVNPYHLKIGDHLLNMKDKVSKCRQSRLTGSVNPFSKLTDSQIVEIRRAYRNRELSQRELAELNNLNVSHIGDILLGKSWSHLNDIAPPIKPFEIATSQVDMKFVLDCRQKGMTQYKIAELIGVNQSVISRRLKWAQR